MSVNFTQLLDRARLDRPRPGQPGPEQPGSAAHSAPAARPSLSETPQSAGETPWQDAWLAC